MSEFRIRNSERMPYFRIPNSGLRLVTWSFTSMTWWLIHNTLTAALLAAVVVLVCRWRAAHPALRHALWLVVLAKLIAPPLPVWSFAWPGSLNDWWRGAALA